MNAIKDMTDYTSRMGKSLDDKLFFVDTLKDIPKSKLGYIVDFGCADGLLLSQLHDLGFKDLIGYDNNWGMISIARRNNDPNIIFSGNFDFVKKVLNKDKKRQHVLILSSVIHEVLHYSSNKEIQDFWKFSLSNLDFTYIFIRDMIPSFDINRRTDIYQYNLLQQNTLTNNAQLSEFESEFGSVRNNKNFVHYLLKYRYIENWTRECYENYFPIYLKELLALIPGWREYKIVSHEMLPFIKERTKKILGIDINDKTHLKIIIVKRMGVK